MKKNVKWFLIQRFLLILFLSYACWEPLNYVYNTTLLPAVVSFLEEQQIEISGGSHLGVWILQLLFNSLADILPPAMEGWIRQCFESPFGSRMQISVSSPLYSGVQGAFLRVFVIGMLLFLLAVRTLPYVVGAFCYCRIVAKKFNELLFQEQQEKLAADRRRNLMLSDIAHDIRTPMTTVCAYSKALSEGVVEEEKHQAYLNAIYAKAMRIDELISLLFEYVKLESEGFSLHREPGDLAELVRETAALLYADFEDRGMTLVLEIPEERVCFDMDRLQLGRALTNLLTNALRYGKEGGRVLLRLRELEITVADEGEPIDPDFAAHIFEPFTRGDLARSSRGGSGLGLGIAKKIVEMHGGRLLLKQSFEEGYTKAFCIRLFE